MRDYFSINFDAPPVASRFFTMQLRLLVNYFSLRGRRRLRRSVSPTTQDTPEQCYYVSLFCAGCTAIRDQMQGTSYQHSGVMCGKTAPRPRTGRE